MSRNSRICAQIWTASASNFLVHTGLAISDGVLYAGTATGFSAYDLPSGTTAPARPDPVTLVPDRSLTAQPSR